MSIESTIRFLRFSAVTCGVLLVFVSLREISDQTSPLRPSFVNDVTLPAPLSVWKRAANRSHVIHKSNKHKEALGSRPSSDQIRLICRIIPIATAASLVVMACAALAVINYMHTGWESAMAFVRDATTVHSLSRNTQLLVKESTCRALTATKHRCMSH